MVKLVAEDEGESWRREARASQEVEVGSRCGAEKGLHDHGDKHSLGYG